MPCESCHAQFTVFKRKKTCTECRRLYCNQCLVKRRERIFCERCLVFTTRPLSKIELLKLKPKDLIYFLQSKHISTTGCVEKEELVNLVLIHVNNNEGAPGGGGGDQSSDETCANPFDQIKQTCQNLFSSLSDRIASDFTFDSKTQRNANADRSPSSQSSREPNISSQPRSSRRPSSTPSGASAAPSQAASQSTSPTSPTPATANHILPPSNRLFLPNSQAAVAEPGVRPQRTKPRAPSLYPDLADGAAEQSHSQSPTTASGRLSVNDGCECSDDDVIQGFHRSQSMQSDQLGTSDSLVAGPSGTQTTISPPQKSEESDEHSSFEELCPIPSTAAEVTRDADIWQFLEHEATPLQTSPSHQPNDRLTAETNQPTTINPSIPSPIARLPLNRRRSDSSLLSAGRHSNTMETGTSAAAPIIQPSGSSPLSKRARIACERCGKRKLGLRRQLQRFRRHLEDRNMSEEAMQLQLVAFLTYLELSQRSVSIDMSEDEEASNDGALLPDDAEIRSNVGGVGVGVEQETMDTTEMGSNHATVGDNDEDDDRDFWFGDDEGIHVYGTDDPTGGQTRQIIHLTDYTDSSELEDLTVKQLKEILMLNRVDFKGCCEKNELFDRVKRLWDELKTCPAVDKMPSNDLCKICMDAPIECVILECGHVATCTNCGKVLSECPICRQYIVRVVRLFRA